MPRLSSWPFVMVAALGLPSCAYTQSIKPGDAYIFILIGCLIGLGILFGTVTRNKDEIFAADVTRVQRHKDSVHEAEDEIRVKRQALYLAQQEMLGYYERLLTDKQKKDPKLMAAKRKSLDLEKEILLAEGRRNQLLKKAP